MTASPTTVAEGCARRLRLVIHGAVQGVGFRPFVYRLATSLGLMGWVLNSSEGVFIEVEGPEPALRDFSSRIETDKPSISFIQSLEAASLDPVGYSNFEIRESSGGNKTTLILPDIATCPECIHEIFDPRNRRYRYPFTNCTNCGPRFSIIESLPYDRPRTTMSEFRMCPDCEREYHDPSNRRFHAQPNACPACGPQLALLDRGGRVCATSDEALRAAGEAIAAGQIVAVKGVGGFHLLCDARDERTVQLLRSRKDRHAKPLAVMFPRFEEVERVCEISATEMRLLRSIESPIVLLRKRAGVSQIAVSVAPGNPYLGVLLPYAPLHHLLLCDVDFPVVATSGNLSEEPICTDERDALKRLHGIADLFLVHNRPIARHVDDSVARVMAERELVIRRARGFAPLPVHVKAELPAAIAVGAQQKNAVAISVGHQVFISQHVGDLETAPSLSAFEHTITALGDMYDVSPQLLVCDQHPSYLSTQYAKRRIEPVVEVQHHYAHVLSCMAENEIDAPVLGIAWDGSGYGTDGTVWGGEFLHVDKAGFTRVAHLRTFRLPGNEQAVREPRRVALSLLRETFGDALPNLDSPAIRSFTGSELRVLLSMLAKNLNSPATSSVGRLFDGVASLIGLRQVCGFEGQAAMELEFAAAGTAEAAAYPFALDHEEGRWLLDWRPMVRAIVADAQAANPEVAARFHATLVAAGVEIACRVGEPRVVLTGGCFQNCYLTERFVEELRKAGFTPYWHQRVPPNDGGIALGQIMAAARMWNPTGGRNVSRGAR